MKNKKQITNRTIVWTAVIGAILVVIFVSANSLNNARKTSIATDEAIHEVSAFYLEEMADRRAKTITNLINSNFDEMEKAIDFIVEEEIRSQDELRESIGKVKSLLGLNRFALVDEDDVVYTRYTTYTGKSRHEFLNDGQLNGRIITTVSVYGSNRQLCLAIPTPDLKLLRKQFKACFVMLDINDIVDLLAFDDQGRTHFAIYSKSGVNLSGTSLGPVVADRNFFEALKDIVPENIWLENYDNFQNGKTGNIKIDLSGADETLYYAPVEGTGWEMAVLIRESVIQDRIRDISDRNIKDSRSQILFTFVAVLLLAAVLFILIRKMSKDMLEEEKETSRTFQTMANTDSMTGVRNKYAYSEMESLINKKIAAGGIEKLGVIVADINGLKDVNDNQGHAAGDKLIKDASRLICEHFKQGAVFRIGGDEFTVILEGDGFDSMDKAIEEMNRKVEDNIKTNEVVVSIGHSTFKEGDRTLRDIFERADKLMYERKQKLKSMGAKTRM